MRLVMDAVKAVQWNGDNFEAVQSFLEPTKLTLIVRGERLLLIDTGDKVHWVRLSDWLTQPENTIGTYEVVDTRKDYDEAGSRGFKSDKLCILSMGRVKAEFRIELDETDNTSCPVCSKPLYDHTVVVGQLPSTGDRLEYVCPPDMSNDIDSEFASLEVLPVESDELISSAEAQEFKKQVVARVLGPEGVEWAETVAEGDGGALFDIGAELDPDVAEAAEIVIPELDEDEMDSSLLDAQNSWRK